MAANQERYILHITPEVCEDMNTWQRLHELLSAQRVCFVRRVKAQIRTVLVIPCGHVLAGGLCCRCFSSDGWLAVMCILCVSSCAWQVIEYTGEVVRPVVADLREKKLYDSLVVRK